MHPMFLQRLEQVINEHPDARAFVFAQERHDAIGNLSATPGNVLPYHIDGGQVVLHTSIIGRHRWSDNRTGDAELIQLLYSKHPEKFVFIDELLTYHDRLTWPLVTPGGLSIKNVLIVVPSHHKYEQARISREKMHLPCQVEWLEIENDTDEEPGYRAILRKYQQAREHFLTGDYDAMLCLEDDMIVPPDALERMLLVDSGIVYSMYNSRHHHRQCNVFFDVSEYGGRGITHYDAVRYNDSVIECVGAGQGCTLIHRPVLAEIPFRLHPDRASYAPDWWLAIDAKAKGFRQHAHLGVKCGHMISANEAVYPDINTPYLFRATPV
jgi:hypothetical protein